jgi:hypothetical protein
MKEIPIKGMKRNTNLRIYMTQRNHMLKHDSKKPHLEHSDTKEPIDNVFYIIKPLRETTVVKERS